MSSIFRLLRRGGNTSGNEATAEPIPSEPSTYSDSDEAPMAIAADISAARDLTTDRALVKHQAIDDMLKALKAALGLPIDDDDSDDADDSPEDWPTDLPKPVVSVTSVAERALAVGNRRGTESRSSFAVVELKGGRLDAVVCFQFLGGRADVEAAVGELHRRMIAAKDNLWKNGILRYNSKETPLADLISDMNVWRKTADYQVLYEFHYQDTDGAESLISRIPVDIDGEYNEAIAVTDEMVRWDDHIAPALEVRATASHSFHVDTLSILAFLPDGWDGSEVTISTSVGGTIHEQTFDNMREFLDAFDLDEVEGMPLKVELGANSYVAGRLPFPNAYFPDPIILKGSEDVFQISYADGRFLGEIGDEVDSVVYLKVV